MTPIDVSERRDFAIASRCRGHVAEETEDALKAVSVENAASRACAPRAVLRRPPTQIKSSSRFLDHADVAWQSYISVKYTVAYDHSVLKRRRQEMYAFTPARRRASPRSLTRCELWKKRRAPAADALALAGPTRTHAKRGSPFTHATLAYTTAHVQRSRHVVALLRRAGRDPRVRAGTELRRSHRRTSRGRRASRPRVRSPGRASPHASSRRRRGAPRAQGHARGHA